MIVRTGSFQPCRKATSDFEPFAKSRLAGANVNFLGTSPARVCSSFVFSTSPLPPLGTSNTSQPPDRQPAHFGFQLTEISFLTTSGRIDRSAELRSSARSLREFPVVGRGIAAFKKIRSSSSSPRAKRNPTAACDSALAAGCTWLGLGAERFSTSVLKQWQTTSNTKVKSESISSRRLDRSDRQSLFSLLPHFARLDSHFASRAGLARVVAG